MLTICRLGFETLAVTFFLGSFFAHLLAVGWPLFVVAWFSRFHTFGLFLVFLGPFLFPYVSALLGTCLYLMELFCIFSPSLCPNTCRQFFHLLELVFHCLAVFRFFFFFFFFFLPYHGLLEKNFFPFLSPLPPFFVYLSSSADLCWTFLHQFGPIFDRLWPNFTRLDPFVVIWTRLGLFGAICSYLESFQAHLQPFGTSWRHLE